MPIGLFVPERTRFRGLITTVEAMAAHPISFLLQTANAKQRTAWRRLRAPRADGFGRAFLSASPFCALLVDADHC